jgi:hypothetical protein
MSFGLFTTIRRKAVLSLKRNLKFIENFLEEMEIRNVLYATND